MKGGERLTDRENGKRIYYITASFLCMLLILLFAVIIMPQGVDYDIVNLRNLMADDGHIIHAGGFLNAGEVQVSYTNSLEALENLYAKGNRFCEIDLQETADGMLICGHGDENELVFGTGLSPDATGEEFMNCRIWGKFTPLSASELAAFVQEHPDLYIITDVKTDNIRVCKRISAEYPHLRDRIVVQIQLPKEYDLLREMGFRYIMYPIFKTPDEERNVLSLATFARRHELVALILPNGYYSPDFKLSLAEKMIGVPIVLHTLNDEWEINYYLNHNLALAVYTDRTDL